MLLIKNGLVLQQDGTFLQGDVLCKGSRIVQVGQGLADQGRVIDATGCYVLPGLIDAHCHVGMLEDGVGVEGNDVNEVSALSTPELRGVDGINPRDYSFTEAMRVGVTTVVTGPGSANVIGGQFCALKTCPGDLEDKLLAAPVALKVAFGENPKREHKDKLSTRMANAAVLRREFLRAKDYGQRRTRGDCAYDEGCEVLLAVLQRELPLKIHAHRADDMQTAVRICKEFGVDFTLDHCTEGHLVVPWLKENKIKCIIGPVLITRPKVEMRNLSFGLGAVLEQAGMEIAITTDHPETPVTLLAASAGMCVRNGMSEAAAFRAITINPARLTGIADRVGSLEAGKDADIVLFDGHPFDMRTKAVLTIINGEVCNKNEEL